MVVFWQNSKIVLKNSKIVLIVLDNVAVRYLLDAVDNLLNDC